MLDLALAHAVQLGGLDDPAAVEPLDHLLTVAGERQVVGEPVVVHGEYTGVP